MLTFLQNLLHLVLSSAHAPRIVSVNTLQADDSVKNKNKNVQKFKIPECCDHICNRNEKSIEISTNKPYIGEVIINRSDLKCSYSV